MDEFRRQVLVTKKLECLREFVDLHFPDDSAYHRDVESLEIWVAAARIVIQMKHLLYGIWLVCSLAALVIFLGEQSHMAFALWRISFVFLLLSWLLHWVHRTWYLTYENHDGAERPLA